MTRPWTMPELKRLATLYQKFKIEGCAMILDRTYDSVRIKAIEMKLKSPFNPLGRGALRQYYAEDLANMFELKAGGFSNSEIAKCFNTDPRAITLTMSKARKHGFDRYPKRSEGV